MRLAALSSLGAQDCPCHTAVVDHKPHEELEPRRLAFPDSGCTSEVCINYEEQPEGRAGGELAPGLEVIDDSIMLHGRQRGGSDHVHSHRYCAIAHAERPADVPDPAVVHQGLLDGDGG